MKTPVPFFFQAEDGIRALYVTGVQTCALPIFTFEAIAELADALPRDLTGRLSGGLPVAWGEADDIPRGAEERPGDVVRTIQENASRLMLWEIEQKPEYRALTNACLDELQACIANQSG